MSGLDDRFAAAAQDLRGELDHVEVPAFRPKRPKKAPAAFLVLVLIGIGIAGYLGNLQSETDGIAAVVATQPEAADPEVADAELPDDAAVEATDDLAEAEPEGDSDTSGIASTDDLARAEAADDLAGPDEDSTDLSPSVTERPDESALPPSPLIGQLTSAAPGQFLVPLADHGSWSADESKLLLYSTGAPSASHVAVDTASGDVIVELLLDPPDVEQVYWHPQDPDRLVYATGPSLLSYSVSTEQTVELHRFDGCDHVGSGVLPVAPSPTGIVSLLCESDDGTSQVSYDLVTGAEQRVATLSDTAAFPSPSGSRFVRWNDTTVSVLDENMVETGVVLDVQGNLFSLIATSDGREWAATTLFDGPNTGTLVLLPLDGVGDPVVVIGEANGDPFPPSGTRISASANTVVVSTRGPIDGGLAGLVIAVDVADPTNPGPRWTFAHNGADTHDYWSSVFVSASPSGRYVAYSTDLGTDQVNTFIAHPTG